MDGANTEDSIPTDADLDPVHEEFHLAAIVDEPVAVGDAAFDGMFQRISNEVG